MSHSICAKNQLILHILTWKFVYDDIFAVNNRVMKGSVVMPRKGENIYKRKDGRWEGRYIKEKVDGKTKYGYVFAYTYRDVKERLRIAKSQVTVPAQLMNDRVIYSFSSLANEWINANSPQWKISSFTKYSNILNNYLLPEFGQCNIEEITRDAVIAYVSRLLTQGGIRESGLAPKTVNSILSVMKNIFEFAAINKGLVLISFKGLNAKQSQKTMRILSQAEQKELNEYLLDNPGATNLGILISLYTGLRIGELCALKWEDISFDDRCIHVHKTMQRIQTSNNSDSKTKVIISTPKSDCSIRHVPIPDRLLVIMKENQKASNTYILTGLRNSFVEPRTLQYRFKSIIKRAGIAPANFHALRHTFATRCIELGFDIKSLSEILGHASVNITLNRYVHPSMELKQKNMDRLSELLAVK